MTLPMLVPVTLAYDPWAGTMVGPDLHFERVFTLDGMRRAWRSGIDRAGRDLADWLVLNMATPGKIVGWGVARTEDGLEVRGTVEFDDGQVWRMTYGWLAPGNWRVRKVHRPR